MLTIQKLVILLQEDHLDRFRGFLKQSGHSLPLKMVDRLTEAAPAILETDDLCMQVYGDKEEKTKKKLFQLAHYTFRLSTFLARRYPYYLSHNIGIIEQHFNSGRQDDALFLADLLLDISKKTEDHATQTWVLKFLINHYNIKEKRKEAIRHQQMLNQTLRNELLLNEIQLYYREHLHFKDKEKLTEQSAQAHLGYFAQFHEHDCFQIRILSRFGTCNALSFIDDARFYAEENRRLSESMIAEMEKHSYVIFPFADDFLLNLDYLHLKFLIKELNEEEIMREATRISKKWNTLRFWQNHVNTPQIVTLSIQVSYFITHYCISYKENYREEMPAHIRDSIDETLELAKQLVEQMKDEKEAHIRFINLNNIYCMLLLLCGKEKIKESVSILESLMINYQQIPFQKLYDAIFVNLIIGYFSLKDHEGVSDCYRRYEKLTAGKIKIEENDLTIKAFYYVSQWLQTGREQYLDKIESLLNRLKSGPQLHSTFNLVQELVRYFKLPVKKIKE